MKTEKQKFSEGEKIFAHHQGLVYEAKILDVEYRTESAIGVRKPYYLIHYQGWKDRWNEYVPEDLILKYNEKNKKLKRKLYEDTKQREQKKAKMKIVTRGSRKRKASAVSRDTFPIEIPSKLKVILLADREKIVTLHLISLPAKVTVADILLQFSEKNRAKEEETNENYFDEVAEGLRRYFDIALGNMLLYRFERAQFGDLKKKHSKKDPSAIYGAEYLLRLFVKLPILLSNIALDEKSSTILQEKLTDFLSFLEANEKQFFQAKYEKAPASYVRAAEV
eukprot:TRINITY_DN20145_c0_g1_i1.p1 TRINITY_DN20145_c0_g1~~TRINITY_DN20145_c0_g1_i1.p1  ORF type:complete len:279 (+),score=55.43 TRINITY_DN20145_c0_g1_i1:34-870(+)